MKKKLLLLFIMGASFSSAKMYADNPEDYYSESIYDVYLYQEPAYEIPEPPPVEPVKENRKPAKRIIATLSVANGIEISGVDVSDIYSFEIYDENGGCLGIFSDLEDFVQVIFLYNESLKIRLLTAEYALVGYL